MKDSKEWDVEFFGAAFHKTTASEASLLSKLVEAVQFDLELYLEGRQPVVTLEEDGTYQLSWDMEQEMISATKTFMDEKGIGLAEEERNKLNTILIDPQDRQLVY